MMLPFAFHQRACQSQVQIQAQDRQDSSLHRRGRQDPAPTRHLPCARPTHAPPKRHARLAEAVADAIWLFLHLAVGAAAKDRRAPLLSFPKAQVYRAFQAARPQQLPDPQHELQLHLLVLGIERRIARKKKGMQSKVIGRAKSRSRFQQALIGAIGVDAVHPVHRRAGSAPLQALRRGVPVLIPSHRQVVLRVDGIQVRVLEAFRHHPGHLQIFPGIGRVRVGIFQPLCDHLVELQGSIVLRQVAFDLILRRIGRNGVLIVCDFCCVELLEMKRAHPLDQAPGVAFLSEPLDLHPWVLLWMPCGQVSRASCLPQLSEEPIGDCGQGLGQGSSVQAIRHEAVDVWCIGPARPSLKEGLQGVVELLLQGMRVPRRELAIHFHAFNRGVAGHCMCRVDGRKGKGPSFGSSRLAEAGAEVQEATANAGVDASQRAWHSTDIKE
eukprot:scaffold1175_cov248-Pinguiococcus_pyrenoidosus.AAC.5